MSRHATSIRIAVIAILALGLTLPGIAQSTSQPTQVTKKRGTRRALLIGVSDYQRANKEESWWDLSSHRDVEQLRAVLASERFAFDDIRVLTDRSSDGKKTSGQTTSAAILDAMKKVAADTKEGDVVYVHYSGHGMAVPDDNNDEPDGFDETIVPSDYKSKRDGTGNIRDDEIGRHLDAIAAKKPKSLTMTFDSCFSGNATRGSQLVARGDFLYQPASASARGGEEFVARGPSGEEATGLLRPGATALQVATILSAGRSDQVVWEDRGRGIGIFTAALVAELQKAGNRTSYRDLYEAVAARVAAETSNAQEPQIEGLQDRQLFEGAEIKPAAPYFLVDVSGRDITMGGGQVHGITVDSVVALYPAGTNDPSGATPLAEATATDTTLGSSSLRLIPKEGKAAVVARDVRGTRAFVKSIAYDENRLVVDLTPLEASAKATARKLDEIEIVDPAPVTRGRGTPARYDLRACVEKCPDGAIPEAGVPPGALLLQRYDGTWLPPVAAGPRQLSDVRELLEREARMRLVRSLVNDVPGSRVSVDLRIVRAELVRGANGRVKQIVRKEEIVPVDGRYALRPGDTIAFDVRNHGMRDAWVTIVDIYEDDKGPWARPIYPLRGMGRDENKIPATADGAWRPIPDTALTITPVNGGETIKLIATAQWMDLASALDPVYVRGPEKGTRGGIKGHPLAELMQNATSGTRGDPVSVDTSDVQWATREIVLDVEPAR